MSIIPSPHHVLCAIANCRAIRDKFAHIESDQDGLLESLRSEVHDARKSLEKELGIRLGSGDAADVRS